MTRSLLRAPREDRTTFCSPDFGDWPNELRVSAARLVDQAHTRVAGASLGELRRQAREEAVSAATDYLRAFDPTVSPPDVNSPLVALGHQPELFHPGVWIKSFAGHRLAKAVSGVCLNFLADADTIKHTAIYVPSGTLDRPHAATIAYDRWTSEIPFEEVRITEDEVHAQFPDRVADAMKGFPFPPIIQDYWDRVMEARRTTENLGECLAAGRRSLEADFGCQNLEVPLTRLCQTTSFQRLASDILHRIESFRSIYNQALRDYRQRHHVRSRNHPATDLAEDEGWSESPFWVWQTDSPRRQALWARVSAKGVELRVANDVIRLHASDAESLQRRLSPWKIRPRAFITTIYARLLLSDWFIHGIGGAMYDEATDDILRHFYGVHPPGFGVLTATVLLPGADPSAGQRLLAQLTRERRDIAWNPDRHLDDTLREREPLAGWIERKIALQRIQPGTSSERKARFREFRSLNEKIFPYVQSRWQSIEDDRIRRADRVRSAAHYSSRELAFCLHPRETIEWLSSNP